MKDNQINIAEGSFFVVMDIVSKIKEIGEDLEIYDIKRDELIRTARSLNRISGNGISALIRNENPSESLQKAAELFNQVKAYMEQLTPVVPWNSINSDVEEYCEFAVLYNIIHNNKFISAETYLFLLGFG